MTGKNSQSVQVTKNSQGDQVIKKNSKNYQVTHKYILIDQVFDKNSQGDQVTGKNSQSVQVTKNSQGDQVIKKNSKNYQVTHKYILIDQVFDKNSQGDQVTKKNSLNYPKIEVSRKTLLKNQLKWIPIKKLIKVIHFSQISQFKAFLKFLE